MRLASILLLLLGAVTASHRAGAAVDVDVTYEIDGGGIITDGDLFGGLPPSAGTFTIRWPLTSLSGTLSTATTQPGALRSMRVTAPFQLTFGVATSFFSASPFLTPSSLFWRMDHTGTFSDVHSFSQGGTRVVLTPSWAATHSNPGDGGGFLGRFYSYRPSGGIEGGTLVVNGHEVSRTTVPTTTSTTTSTTTTSSTSTTTSTTLPGSRIAVCHKSQEDGSEVTLRASGPAIEAHLRHGDRLGACVP